MCIYFPPTLILTLDYSCASVPIPAVLNLLLILSFSEWSALCSFDPNSINFDQIKFHILMKTSFESIPIFAPMSSSHILYLIPGH